MTAFYIPYINGVIGFTNSQSQRDSVSAFRLFFESVGMLVGVVIHGVFLAVGTHAPRPSHSALKVTLNPLL